MVASVMVAAPSTATTGNRQLRGKLIYWTESDGTRLERGREWFTTTWHPDGVKLVTGAT